ncbi:hypothetical protein CRE_21790 [Caenorhabditis remanei]|uniref:SET domain-containing protein n=2 Tax=Caenorhabditis remanei TaxID=31234 RepID=E3MEG8_CAERE|nr:hypothetical protein CRE_21790 [Caenorhabditis remanei]
MKMSNYSKSLHAEHLVVIAQLLLAKTSANCKTTCKNQNFRYNRYCHFTTVDTGDMGKNVIAIRDIPKGSFFCVYTGEIIALKAYEQWVQEYAEAEAYYLDLFKIGNAAKFVNHSCSSKMIALRWKIDGMDRRFRAIGYFAVEFIKARTPLTVNYQFDYDE